MGTSAGPCGRFFGTSACHRRGRKAEFDHDVPALHIVGFLQALAEGVYKMRHVVERSAAEKPDHRHRLLRTRRERPRCCHAAEQSDELAALHSITSSAMESTPGGTSMLSACAVCKFRTNSNLVDCSTGSSAGFSPFSILPA